MTGNWLLQSCIATVCLVPAWLAIGFFGRNYKIGPDIFLMWYLFGIAISLASYKASSHSVIVPSWKIVGAILIIGMTIGASANILLFRAVGGAPNPGIPVAIANVASVGVFLAGALLFRLFPNSFNSVKIDPWTLFGIILTIIGTSIIGIRR